MIHFSGEKRTRYLPFLRGWPPLLVALLLAAIPLFSHGLAGRHTPDDSFLKNIEIRLDLPKTTYRWNETVSATLTLRNLLPDPLELKFSQNHQVKFTLTHRGALHAQTLFSEERVDLPIAVTLPPHGKLIFKEAFNLSDRLGDKPLYGPYWVDARVYFHPRHAGPLLRRDFKVIPESNPLQKEDEILEIPKMHSFEAKLKNGSPAIRYRPIFGKNDFTLLKSSIRREGEEFLHIFTFKAKNFGEHEIGFDEMDIKTGAEFPLKRHQFRVNVIEEPMPPLPRRCRHSPF